MGVIEANKFIIHIDSQKTFVFRNCNGKQVMVSHAVIRVPRTIDVVRVPRIKNFISIFTPTIRAAYIS